MQWDRIIVIATQTRVPLKETAQSVDHLTSQDLFHSMAGDMGDALSLIPAVKIDGGPRGIGEDINIRGMGRARVQIRQDSVRMNFLSEHMGRLFVDQVMVEEVEVLRGAGSSLYGSDALGGVVNIKTLDTRQMLKKDEKFGINSHWDYTSVNRRLKEAMSIFGRPIPQWTYLFSANYWQTGKDIALGDGTLLENSAQEGKQGLSKIFFTPRARLVFSFIHDTFMDTLRFRVILHVFWLPIIF